MDGVVPLGLGVISREHAPDYGAISYWWNGETANESCFCDGLELVVQLMLCGCFCWV